MGGAERKLCCSSDIILMKPLKELNVTSGGRVRSQEIHWWPLACFMGTLQHPWKMGRFHVWL